MRQFITHLPSAPVAKTSDATKSRITAIKLVRIINPVGNGLLDAKRLVDANWPDYRIIPTDELVEFLLVLRTAS